jgi:lipopolysaccharide/colanic/teichoic acid biosynthesis glycosyltransferase
MISTTVLLKTPKVFQVSQAPTRAGATTLVPAQLQWRQNLLLVKAAITSPKVTIPALQNQEWFRDCLHHSPIKAARLDLNLGEETIKAWADTCESAGKSVFLTVPTTATVPGHCYPLSWKLKRVADWLVAWTLLLLLTPLMLILALLIRLDSPGSIFYQQWRVGERGKLFRIIKFRTMHTNAERLHHHVMGQQAGLHKLTHDPRVTSVGRWLRKYSLDELPQLFNVLRGEMSLVGPRPWALYDAMRVPQELRHRLNALPGITGAWQVEVRSQLVDLYAVNHRDCRYLQTWSLWQDLTILLRTVPKVLSGSGAY